jgi:predicted RNA-binding Zn-ribbon protein involved in translation (DUF1610 family)
MSNISTNHRYLVREGSRDFMVWDRQIRGPALVDGHPVVGFSKDEATRIRDALNEPALAGGVRSQVLDLVAQTSMPSLASPHLAPSRTESTVRSDSFREDQAQFARLPSYVESGIAKYGIRPDCPDCGMHMIVVNEVSIVPGPRSYECLRCGHVSKPGNPAPRASTP